MARNKKWSEMTPQGRGAMVVFSLVELLLTAVALRDLARRPRDEVRGAKWMWSLVCLVQPVGPIAYLVVGRRPGASSTAEVIATV